MGQNLRMASDSYKPVRVALAIGLLIVLAEVLHRPGPSAAMIGATAQVVEQSSGVVLTARVDTGARITSLHCAEKDLVIEDRSAIPEENRGKRARLRVHNKPGISSWVETRIHSLVEVCNAEHAEIRYCVELPLRYGGVERPTLVTLNDRSTMTYRLLLGRNFLRGNFLVDVARE